MADKKAVKKRKKGSNDEEGPSKDEKAVAKHMRFNMPTKKATMYGDEVFYFMGSKAVDFLMDSKWASGSKSTVSFTHRDSIASFLTRLLNYGMFSRVHLVKTEKKVKDKKKDGDKKKDEKKTETKEDKKSDVKDTKEEKKTSGSPKVKRDKDGKEVKKVKKKVKITLEPHEQQVFFDSDDEAYVWIYDPVSWKTFILGVLLVLLIIGICLFPLWPESVREYSWYISVAGAIFVGTILVLAVLRYIIYGFLWIVTVGKLNFWLLPNLTAECGFLESFVPVYEYEIKKGDDENKSEKEEKEEKEKVVEKEKEEPESDKTKDVNKEESVPEKNKNDSEDSSASQKDDEWVKVKKGDLDDEIEQKQEVEC